MFRPETVSAHDPNDPMKKSDASTWRRFNIKPWQMVAKDPTTHVKYDDLTNFPDQDGSKKRLTYRLDPPYQDPTPANPLDPSWLAVSEHFRDAKEVFLTAYQFFVKEYSDSHTQYEAANVPTPIDSHQGHFILHPDYGDINSGGKDNGQQAHFNHIHAQLGKTGPE